MSTEAHSKNNHGAWRTQDELAWLTQIGASWRPKAREDQPMPNRIDLLRAYQSSIHKRNRWGNVDRFAVMRFVHDALEGTE
jgi:hypothetical protein